MLVIDTRIKLLLFILINFMVFGLKDFILGSVCFFFICILSCLMGQKKIVLKYLVFYVVIAAIQQLCIYLPQAIETILSIFTLFIRVMIPVVLFASTFIATTKVSELIAAMYSLKIPRSITITFAKVNHPKQKFRQLRLMNVLAVLALHQFPDKVVKLQGQLLIFHIPPADQQRSGVTAALAAQNEVGVRSADDAG